MTRAKPLDSKEKRFWRHVSKTASGCWLWDGDKNSAGYGRFYIRHKGSPRELVYAHRFSWELHNNSAIPKGLMVLHSCDTPACVNPSHLSIGTSGENTHDGIRKHRYPLVKLTWNDVDIIRATPKKYGSRPQLARRFGVNEKTIDYVRNNIGWNDKYRALAA